MANEKCAMVNGKWFGETENSLKAPICFATVSAKRDLRCSLLTERPDVIWPRLWSLPSYKSILENPHE
jgi:hypothetical protein